MSAQKNNAPRSLPTWGDWYLPVAVSLCAVALLGGLFAWRAVGGARHAALEREHERLAAIGQVIGAYAARPGVTTADVDEFIAGFAEAHRLEKAERLEPGVEVHNVNAAMAEVAVPLTETIGSVRLLSEPRPVSVRGELLVIGSVSGLLMALVLVSALPSSRRTAALRRIGSALRAIIDGEADRDVLMVAERFGAEAGAWNELLATREQSAAESHADGPDRREHLSTAGTVPGSAALDAMPIGLMALDETGRLTFCNGAAAAMVGIDRAEAVGQIATELEPFGEIAPAIEKVAAGGTPRTTAEFSRGEGARQDVVRITVRALRRDDEATVMILLEDITQQRIADEARNGFVAQATHELRAPLTNIRLYAEEAIEMGAADPQALARSLNVVNQEARRLERVVADMLSVSEIEAATMTLQIDDVPLGRLFEDLRQDYTAQADEKSIKLEFDLPAKLDAIRADREKVALLLHNVLGNAIKYTPEGGEVRVGVEADESSLTVRVVDSGPGIAPEDHERIFQKFYRTDDARLSETKGSGLGLALAREIARLHGGDITVESEVGRGSTFVVRVPSGQAGSLGKAA